MFSTHSNRQATHNEGKKWKTSSGYIIDMDGFLVKGQFLCKELGVIPVGGKARSFIFDLGISWSQLSSQDRRTAWYVREHVHRLPFHGPLEAQLLPVNRLHDVVTSFFTETRVNASSTVAYKGGNCERDLLAELNIPSVNLEEFNCPKAS